MIKIFQRPHLQTLTKRMREPRSFIQVISGPRQVGKTTLVQQFLESVHVPYYNINCDAVPQTDSIWLEQQWEVARIKWKNSEAKSFILAIDEIQKIHNWSEIIKALWDHDTLNHIPIKVILLGSSRLLLQQGLTESLAGRFEVIYLGHWSFNEMHAAFGWTSDQYAWFGGYPGTAPLLNDESRWKSYVLESLIDPSISKDILSMTRVDKPALMRNVFEFACMYSGQILSYNKMIGQLADAGNTTTCAHYIQLLDSAGLVGGLEKYAPKKIQQRHSSPKYQVHNIALMTSQLSGNYSLIKSQPDQWGRIIESVVGAHLLNHTKEHGSQLFYWREGNDEVDFIFQYKNKTLAIEVKSGRVRNKSGLIALRKKFPIDKVILIEPHGLSWEEFIAMDLGELV